MKRVQGEVHERPEFSVVIPCLDEAETLETCIRKARGYFDAEKIRAEIVVADNGSTDGSREIAARNGARVVPVEKRGYGAALAGGIRAARGRYVIMGDADDTYDFSRLGPFVEKLREGHDLVMGNRFRGGIGPGAMPLLHKYLGNPVLTWIGRVFFKSRCGDFYCGLRGFSRSAFDTMGLVATGMEFALEMNAKASMLGLSVAEVPTTLSTSARTRKPHLRTWKDGWQSLKFFLLFCPRWLFLYPGVILLALATACGALFLLLPPLQDPGHLRFGPLAACAAALILGYQSVIFSVFSKAVAMRLGMHPRKIRNPVLNRLFSALSLDRALAAGLLLTAAGAGFLISRYLAWESAGTAALMASWPDRLQILFLLMLPVGVQTVLSGFHWGLLNYIEFCDTPGPARAEAPEASTT